MQVAEGDEKLLVWGAIAALVITTAAVNAWF